MDGLPSKLEAWSEDYAAVGMSKGRQDKVGGAGRRVASVPADRNATKGSGNWMATGRSGRREEKSLSSSSSSTQQQ